LRLKDLLNLESLGAFDLELYIVSGEHVSEEGFLIDNFDQGACHVVGLVSVALATHYSEVSLVEVF